MAELRDNVWTTKRVEKLLYDAEENGIDYKEVDNPFHENEPELRKGQIIFEYTEEELDEIKRCAEDVVYFADTYCKVMTDDGIRKINLRDYQVQILNQYQIHRKNIFVSPRQSGKCLIPSTNITVDSNKKVSIDKLHKRNKRIINRIVSFLWEIYSKLS